MNVALQILSRAKLVAKIYDGQGIGLKIVIGLIVAQAHFTERCNIDHVRWLKLVEDGENAIRISIQIRLVESKASLLAGFVGKEMRALLRRPAEAENLIEWIFGERIHNMASRKTITSNDRKKVLAHDR